MLTLDLITVSAMSVETKRGKITTHKVGGYTFTAAGAASPQIEIVAGKVC